MPPELQLSCVLCKGTYLARRWEEEGAIALYYLFDGGRGFFAEVGHDAHKRGAFVLRSFRDSTPLESYAQGVRLPE
ncbi:MAG: hypothetical protein EOO63_14840 [Hymenobacter sp.]|nr:MAG: hypothetical protein EOO63_14840 [Hymenobacter sp.]